jgi:hypothetical protein
MYQLFLKKSLIAPGRQSFSCEMTIFLMEEATEWYTPLTCRT